MRPFDVIVINAICLRRLLKKMMTLRELEQSLDALHRANILITSVRKTFIAGHYVTGARVVHDAETRLADQILVLERMISADVELKYKHLTIWPCRKGEKWWEETTQRESTPEESTPI